MAATAEPLLSVQQQARRQQRVEELCAAAVRALTGDAQLRYRGGSLYRGDAPLRFLAPHLRDDSMRADFSDFPSRRGLADAMAQRLRYSDARLHRELSPADPVARLVFELLEQLRVETLVPAAMPGLAANLQQRFEKWSRAFHASRLTETRLGLLLYGLAQAMWSLLHDRPPMLETEDLIESTRARLGRALAGTLGGLRRSRHDQRAYAQYALEVAARIATMVHTAQAQQDEDEPQRDTDDDETTSFALLLDFDDEEDAGPPAAMTTSERHREPAADEYRVFTTRYDQESPATGLVRAAQLRELRTVLDQRIAACHLNRMRLTRALAAILAVPERDGWRFGEEEGYIDGRRLAQIVSSPNERRIFRQELLRPVADCAVSFLIDCSGSMKVHAPAVAIIVDTLVRALEFCGAASEILGFTTGGWNGGRASRDWMRAGRPANPGRLNEALHMVFKSSAQSWRRSRPELAALLKPELFREGLDGEAVQWACSRLREQAVQRRILIVFSDGCPMDTATNLANAPGYLDRHLLAVVARQERIGEVEIMAVGVGLDLSSFYGRSLAIDPDGPIDTALLLEIVELVGGRRRR